MILIAAVLCKLLTGDVSEAVNGLGFDFMQDGPFEVDMPRDMPLALEDKTAIPVPLDREKTARILAALQF